MLPLSILKAPKSYLPCILHGQCNQPGSSLAGTAPLLAGLLTRPCTSLHSLCSAPEVNSQHVDQSRFPRPPPCSIVKGFPPHPCPCCPTLVVASRALWPGCPIPVAPISFSGTPSPPHSADPFTRAQHVFFPPHTLHRSSSLRPRCSFTHFHISSCFPYFKP